MYSFRKANSKDISHIREIASAVLPAAFSGVLTTEQIDFMFDRLYSQEAMQHDFATGQHYTIACCDGVDCGYGSYIRQGPDLYLMPKIYLMNAYKGKGLGRALFQELLKQIKEEHPGPCSVELTLNSHNPSMGFYTKMGMQKVRESGMDLEDFYLSQDVLSIDI